MRQVREYGILCVDTYRGLTLNKNPLKSQAMADLSERLDAYAAAVRAERDADTKRIDWMEAQANPHHGVILCAQVVPGETPWASVQRVDQHHNPHKVEWCHEGNDLRAAIDHAMTAAPSAPEGK
jgi:hypothetical protein